MENLENSWYRRHAGFTLVELLIVVAVIATLAAIAIPMFNGYRLRGYKSELDADAKNAYTASQAYLLDNAVETVDAIDKLKESGYQRSGTVSFVTGSMTVGAGILELSSITLKSQGIDNNAVIFWNGKINFINSP